MKRGEQFREFERVFMYVCAFICADRRNNNVIVKTNRVYEAYKLRPLAEPQGSAAVSQSHTVSAFSLDLCLHGLAGLVVRVP